MTKSQLRLGEIFIMNGIIASHTDQLRCCELRRVDSGALETHNSKVSNQKYPILVDKNIIFFNEKKSLKKNDIFGKKSDKKSDICISKNTMIIPTGRHQSYPMYTM